jgi:hypothetical protein
MQEREVAVAQQIAGAQPLLDGARVAVGGVDQRAGQFGGQLQILVAGVLDGDADQVLEQAMPRRDRLFCRRWNCRSVSHGVGPLAYRSVDLILTQYFRMAIPTMKESVIFYVVGRLRTTFLVPTAALTRRNEQAWGLLNIINWPRL